jgi:hypothetical protein
MYLMYVDESGDCGMPSDGSPCNLFCLSGVVVHELAWRDTIAELLRFRYWLKRKYRIYLEAEIHAAHMLTKPSRIHPSLRQLPKHQRLAIVRHFADQIASLRDVSIINVAINKLGKVPDKDEVFRWAWYSLFQRFENTIRYKNFPGPKNDHERGIVFPDNTDGAKLRRFLNDMRQNNLLKVVQRSGAFVYKNEPIQVLIEDPVLRDSRHSYLIQAADCAAFLLKQSIEPSAFMRRHGGNAYLQRLDSVLCKHASRKDATGQGVVRL